MSAPSSSAARYPVPAARVRAEVVFDRSRFLCTLERAETPEAAQALVRALRQEFPDATHHCWAFVAGPPGSTARIGLSDDGEPHGTAGRPMLTVLSHCGVGEIAAVVTRYYGGTNLGTGGLVRAYSAAVQAALAVLQITERIDSVEFEVCVSYAHHASVRRQLLACEGAIIDEQFADDVRVRVMVPTEREAELVAGVGNTTGGQAIVREVRRDRER